MYHIQSLISYWQYLPAADWYWHWLTVITADTRLRSQVETMLQCTDSHCTRGGMVQQVASDQWDQVPGRCNSCTHSYTYNTVKKSETGTLCNTDTSLSGCFLLTMTVKLTWLVECNSLPVAGDGKYFETEPGSGFLILSLRHFFLLSTIYCIYLLHWKLYKNYRLAHV